jgi:hypothetical protein
MGAEDTNVNATPGAANAPALPQSGAVEDDFPTVVVDELQSIHRTNALKEAEIADLKRQVRRLESSLGSGDIGPVPGARQAAHPDDGADDYDDGENPPPTPPRNAAPPNDAVVAAQARVITDCLQSEFPAILESPENQQLALAIHNEFKELGVITDSTDIIEATKIVGRATMKALEQRKGQVDREARLTKFRRSPDGAKPTGGNGTAEPTPAPTGGFVDNVIRFPT